MILDGKLPTRRGLERRWSNAQSITQHPNRATAAWVYAPHFIGNPYQALLTMAMPGHDIAPIGAATVAEGLHVLRGSQHIPERVLHLHWLNGVLAGAKDAADATRRVKAFEQQLDRMRDSGVRIVWTMHNVLPHESVHEDQEVRIREIICEQAELIHVMNPESVALASEYFRMPEDKVVRIEHPGYSGFYPQWVTRDAARAHFGFSANEHVALVLGAIKPYKGLLELAHEIDAISRRHPRKVQLLIAGGAGRDAGTQELFALADLHPAIQILPEKVPADDIGLLFAAADSAIVPYRASLNSGALVLALSMGKPVLARGTAGSHHLLSDGAGRVYEREEELEALLIEDAWTQEAAVAARRMAHRLRAEHVSGEFARVARAFIDGGVSSARAAAGPNGGLDD